VCSLLQGFFSLTPLKQREKNALREVLKLELIASFASDLYILSQNIVRVCAETRNSLEVHLHGHSSSIDEEVMFIGIAGGHGAVPSQIFSISSHFVL